MIGIDTNVLVRLVVRDDEPQFQAAYALFQNESIWIADSVVLETEWVLRYAYAYSRQEIVQTFRRLFGLKQVHLTDSARMHQVLAWHEQGLDVADALHMAASRSAKGFASFDQKLVKRAHALGMPFVQDLNS
ncbi:MAG: type II toxin-antitoxin system VapC family toxin [Acidobacteria bacterium]|nr:type II toxin-antitoxin system VapC family toxin [Acidobacteriota bacterium]MCB9399049.1 type II toxin-antitoxin system VapC family toxin [Acidobacteriota bacterium]